MSKNTKLSHLEIGRFVVECIARKEEISARIALGVSMSALAKEFDVPISALISAFAAVGLPTKRVVKATTVPGDIEARLAFAEKFNQAVATTLLRVCRNASVKCPELMAFMEPVAPVAPAPVTPAFEFERPA